MKMVSIFCLAFIMSGTSLAGFNGLTHHSRAACGNNESISWDWTANHLLRTVSFHYYQGHYPKHIIDTGWETTWRNAAVHWGEGKRSWRVAGDHYMKDNKGKEYVAAQEFVTDCSIYDGWWDKNK